MSMDLPGIGLAAMGAPASSESLKNDPKGVKKAATQMESMFLFELIKVMRESGESSESGMGQGTFMSMFDMELANVLSGRGTGLRDVILHALSKEQSGHGQKPDTAGSGTSIAPIGQKTPDAAKTVSGLPVHSSEKLKLPSRL